MSMSWLVIRYRILRFEQLRPLTFCGATQSESPMTRSHNTQRHRYTANYSTYNTCHISSVAVKCQRPWQQSTAVSVPYLSMLKLDCDVQANYSSQKMKVFFQICMPWFVATECNFMFVLALFWGDGMSQPPLWMVYVLKFTVYLHKTPGVLQPALGNNSCYVTIIPGTFPVSPCVGLSRSTIHICVTKLFTSLPHTS